MLERLTPALEGRYRVDREVGSGGMAVVYLAEDLRHGRRVALKVLRPEVGHELGGDRFLREIRIAAGLSHPNILPLFDSGEADGLLYYVMPYVEGETLRERLTREGPLPIDEVVRLAGEIGGALARAHGAGIVHRDIKPANVLLESGHALVADFGVARAVDVAGGERLTRTGVAIGTPTYMSPEQAAGEAGEDARSDIYSLGCLIYEMLAGEPPFTAGSAHAVVAAHLAKAVPSLRERRPDVPAGVQDAVERALAKDPQARFDTAAELVDQLTSAITIEARAAHDRSERRRGWVSAAAAVLTLGLASTGVWWATQRAAAPAIEVIAVLPASNLTRDPEQDYFVDGVHEALVLELQRAGVAVSGRQPVLRFRGSDLPIGAIADSLGVDALLQPVVGREGDSVRVDVSLYGRDSDVALWTDSFSETVRGVLGLYRDVSGRIAAEIGIVLSPEAETHLAERPTVDPQVYEMVLRGKHHLRQFRPADVELAEQHFERALELDSSHAPAYLELARVWSSRSQLNLLPTDSTRPVVLGLYDRARELDPELFEADKSRADFLVWREWRWDEGVEAYRRALAADPNNASTHMFFAQTLGFLGRWEESAEHSRRAVELDRFDPLILGMRAMQLGRAGRFQEALEALEAHPATHPSTGVSHAPARVALMQLGRQEEAVAVSRAYHESRGDAVTVAAQDGGLRDGGPLEAFRRAADARASTWRRTSTINIAEYYAWAGEWESALEWLERAVDVRDANMPVVGSHAAFWPLHDDPRFRAIVEGIGLPMLQGQPG